jgi:hypothetical protein
MLKVGCLALMLFMVSGCCEVFGICTSVNVHTRATSPDKFASLSLDLQDGFGPLPSSSNQTQPQWVAVVPMSEERRQEKNSKMEELADRNF